MWDAEVSAAAGKLGCPAVATMAAAGSPGNDSGSLVAGGGESRRRERGPGPGERAPGHPERCGGDDYDASAAHIALVRLPATWAQEKFLLVANCGERSAEGALPERLAYFCYIQVGIFPSPTPLGCKYYPPPSPRELWGATVLAF